MSAVYKQQAIKKDSTDTLRAFPWLTNWVGLMVYVAIALGALSRYDFRIVETPMIPRPHQTVITDFYNYFGGWFMLFEEHAIESMLEHCDIHSGQVVVEIGPGTGALAEQILHKITNEGAITKTPLYYGVDVSDTMHNLAKKRLAKYIEAGSAVVEKTDASHDYVDYVTVPVDRFVVSYVFDLLEPKEITRMMQIMKNKLADDDARICVVNFTYGHTAGTRIITNIWQIIYYLFGGWVFGGCRPFDMLKYLTPDLGLKHTFLTLIDAYGIPSQVVVIGKGIAEAVATVAAAAKNPRVGTI